MDIEIKPTQPHGTIKAIASKSVAHRLLICAAFSDCQTSLRCEETNADISATVRCLEALGAQIICRDGYFDVTPIEGTKHKAIADCGESGSTLRFLLPVVCALGSETSFLMSGRLPSRPLSPLREELQAHGAHITASVQTLDVSGKISAGEYNISGSVSSQFISGLLFALSLCEGESRLCVSGKIESAPYVMMTLDALCNFGANISRENDGHTYTIKGSRRLHSSGVYTVEGDWSNAAFPLAAGAVGGYVCVSGLDTNSQQGDREILSLLSRFGAKCDISEGRIIVTHAPLCGIDIDASQIPDLVPVLAVTATAAKGDTRIYGAARLRLKESDRIMSTAAMLRALGADIDETDDGLIIHGGKKLCGGVVNSFNDHRIAMSAAVASAICGESVTVRDAQAVNKSYPSFWDDIPALGFQTLKI